MTWTIAQQTPEPGKIQVHTHRRQNVATAKRFTNIATHSLQFVEFILLPTIKLSQPKT